MTDPTGFSGKGGQIEPIDRMLAAMIIFFTLIVVGISLLSPADGQTFQVLSGLLAGAMGAFLARVSPSKAEPPPGSTTVTQIDQITKVDPVIPKGGMV